MAVQYSEAKNLLEMNDVTKNHWETIQQWRIDEGKNFARSRGTQISRMAAGGMKAGSTQWEANLAAIDAKNKAELESQGQSATQGILDRWTDTMKDLYIEATQTKDITRHDDDYTVPTDAAKAVEKFGGGKNPYADLIAGGGTEEDYRNLSTDAFMELSFGTSDPYKEFTDASGDKAAAAKVETKRQQGVRSKSQQASPWWA